MSIQISNLKKSYGKQEVLKGVNITFRKNAVTGLIGFNGSGKTTTFNIMTNFIEKYSGSVLFEGKPATIETRKTISYLASGSEPKNPQKVISHLLSIAFMYGLSKSAAIVKINELAQQLDFNQFVNRPIKSLSKGNQQKIKVIAALINPHLQYLFLDEPFDGLDPIMVNKLTKLFMGLKEVTIIITSHNMAVVQEMCDEFYVLKDGVLVEAKKNDDKTVLMVVNEQVDVSKVKTMKGVLEVGSKNGLKTILIEEISYFKAVNEQLLKDNNYVYSSIKERNIAEAVFERYENE